MIGTWVDYRRLDVDLACGTGHVVCEVCEVRWYGHEMGLAREPPDVLQMVVRVLVRRLFLAFEGSMG